MLIILIDIFLIYIFSKILNCMIMVSSQLVQEYVKKVKKMTIKSQIIHTIICSRSQTSDMNVQRKRVTTRVPLAMSAGTPSMEKSWRTREEKKEERRPEKTRRWMRAAISGTSTSQQEATRM